MVTKQTIQEKLEGLTQEELNQVYGLILKKVIFSSYDQK